MLLLLVTVGLGDLSLQRLNLMVGEVEDGLLAVRRLHNDWNLIEVMRIVHFLRLHDELAAILRFGPELE